MTKTEELFEAIYEACPELENGCSDIKGNWHKFFRKEDVELSHLLRTAEKRGIRTSIDSKGQLFILIGTCWTFVCNLELTKSVADQSPETLEKIGEVVV